MHLILIICIKYVLLSLAGTILLIRVNETKVLFCQPTVPSGKDRVWDGSGKAQKGKHQQEEI